MNIWHSGYRLVVPGFLMLAACAAQQNPHVNLIDTGKILNSYFKDEIEYRFVGQKKALLYCPDNTCDEFEAAKTIDTRVLNDFAYLLFFHTQISNFPNVQNFRDQQERSVVDDILKRNSGDCASAAKDFVKCVIAGMRDRYGIRTFFVRYDDKTRNAREVDIMEMFAK